MTRDVLQRPLDAAGNPIRNLAVPTEAGDATFTDNVSAPSAIGVEASAGSSLLAAPADHVHQSTTPMRTAASGRTTVAAGARVTLAELDRREGELFAPAGFVYVTDDVDGATWAESGSGAEDDIFTYHERTGAGENLRFCAFNAGKEDRTIQWATVALSLPTG